MPDDPRVLHEGRWLRTLSCDGWEYVSRVRGTQAACIAARTTDHEMLLVEQFRRPFGRPVIELPAGLVGDEPGHDAEAALDAARRELLEETGFGGGRWVDGHRGPVTAGLSDELVHLFLADGVERQGPGGGVGGEAITVHRIGFDALLPQVRAWADAGALVDHKVLLGWFLLSIPDLA